MQRIEMPVTPYWPIILGGLILTFPVKIKRWTKRAREEGKKSLTQRNDVNVNFAHSKASMHLFFPPQKWTYGQRIIEFWMLGNEFNPECYVKMTIKMQILFVSAKIRIYICRIDFKIWRHHLNHFNCIIYYDSRCFY